jgi:hypothetical protein
MKTSSRPRTSFRFSYSVHHQLNMYALAASAAGVAVLALAPSSEAKVVYTKVHHWLYPPNSHYRLDLNHDGITDFVFSDISCNGSCESSAGGALSIAPRGKNAVMVAYQTSFRGSFFASALPAGVKIQANNRFKVDQAKMAATWRGPVSSGRSGRWLNVNNRYLGLRFSIKGKTHYGWARLDVSCGSSEWCNGLVTGYAYETIPNKPIVTGKTKGPDVIIVQPVSLGHLAAGASAIPAWRSVK